MTKKQLNGVYGGNVHKVQVGLINYAQYTLCADFHKNLHDAVIFMDHMNDRQKLANGKLSTNIFYVMTYKQNGKNKIMVSTLTGLDGTLGNDREDFLLKIQQAQDNGTMPRTIGNYVPAQAKEVAPEPPAVVPDPAQRYTIFNVTDGFYASQEDFSSQEADEFIKEFPRRYDAQGYYKDSNGNRINPDSVRLRKEPFTPEPDTDEFDEQLSELLSKPF